MVKNLSIAVILGGWSQEREVSLESGKACAEALKKLGHRVTMIDVQSDMRVFLDQLDQAKPDMVFNALHGSFGEDGCIQGLLEMLKIPYTHSAVGASSLAMDKLKTKIFLQAHDIPFPNSREIVALGQAHPFPLPYVLKPVSEGSSIGVHIFSEGDPAPTERLYNAAPPSRLMVESYIKGRELTVSVLNGTALGVTEICPEGGGFYDYHAKYHVGLNGHICPAKIDPDIAKIVMQLSEKAFTLLGCKTVCRCDFRYDPDQEEGRGIYMLELNTHPGMTSVSLVPEQARQEGIGFEALVQLLVEGAL